MDHEQKPGAGLLQLLQFLWLLPHAWAVPEGKTLAPLRVRPSVCLSVKMSLGLDECQEGSVSVGTWGEGCCSRVASTPGISHALSVCRLKSLRDLCKSTAWEMTERGLEQSPSYCRAKCGGAGQ